jgi:hypothetical protein
VYYGILAANENEVLTTFLPVSGDAMNGTLSESGSASSVKLTDSTQPQTQSLTGSGDTNVLLLEGYGQRHRQREPGAGGAVRPHQDPGRQDGRRHASRQPNWSISTARTPVRRITRMTLPFTCAEK